MQRKDVAVSLSKNLSKNNKKFPDKTLQENQGFIWHNRHYLPHLYVNGVTQFVTFRLFDAVPAEIIDIWKQEMELQTLKTSSENKIVMLERKIEQYADSGKGSCFLKDNEIAKIVQDALFYYDKSRYSLISWCLMPNHVHVLLTPINNHSLSDIIHNWKSFTAHKSNRILNRKGKFWLTEYFDRYIRDDRHFNNVIDYIINNPVKSGLISKAEDWKWSGIKTNGFNMYFQGICE